MDNMDSFTKNGAPIFDGTNYAFWKVRMRIYVMAQGLDIWELVQTSYSGIANLAIDQAGKKLTENNAKSMNAMFSGLINFEYVKVMECESAK